MEILTYYEWQTAQVQRYRCKFIRWEYDPIRLPNDPDIAATISKGSIQYASPDKGLFKVEQVWDIAMTTEKVIDKQTGKEQQVTRPSINNGKAEHAARKEVFDEHWICDGKSIFEVNGRNQQIIERPLPPGMQGKQITQGPLPFLFGAKVETIRQQYWIREVIPQPIPEKVMLEAIPRRAQEAADFREIRIVLHGEEYLPEAILLFHRSGGRSNYEFQDREKNWSIIPEKLNPFHQQFFRPQVKPGWKLVTEPFGADPAAAGPAPAIGGNAIPPRQAIRQLPAAGTKR
jgi:TIGR03009 family protein